ncbi:MAG: hypothetical protein JWM56_771 [Candidatus Peribacteria bacterium]|nr:hypothetical protein [Candidatus Peribacteria bacterium]
MIITQPDRYILVQQVAARASVLTGRLLDIGSGRSRRYQRFCTHVSQYQTLDHDKAGNPDILGSAENIPLTDSSVDSVLCTQVLEHVPHPALVIQEIYRILTPNGLCLLTAPQTNELHEEPHDYFRYTSYGLISLFKEAGFTILQLDQRGNYHATIMQIKIRHLVNTWKPYENKFAMLILSPLTYLLTHYALFRDQISRNKAGTLHAIGWCILAKKI